MNVSEIFNDVLKTAEKNDFSSYDISDLHKTTISRLGSKISNLTIKKIVMKPYDILIKNFPSLIRFFVKDKYFKYPQGVAMTIRGLIGYYNKTSQEEYLEKAISLGDWLIDNSSAKDGNMGWGQPFIWYSRMIFPANTPRATVSSQAGWAFIDLYEVTSNKKYLNVLEKIYKCFRDEFNYELKADGSFCLSYTTVDKYHIHNSNVLASSMLARTANLIGNKEIKDFATRATSFTLNHQNEDGSFYYWAPPNKLAHKIDHIHTGFVLESLETLQFDLPELNISQAYSKGLDYYYKNLFNGVLPKIDIHKTYPIDIQSCAQALITFANTSNKEYRAKAKQILNFTLDKFYLISNKHFAYQQISESSKIDKNYYYRWGDSWMLKALPNYLD
jgi:uncharacterized protein YyaL (SSP411 family)